MNRLTELNAKLADLEKGLETNNHTLKELVREGLIGEEEITEFIEDNLDLVKAINNLKNEIDDIENTPIAVLIEEEKPIAQLIKEAKEKKPVEKKPAEKKPAEKKPTKKKPVEKRDLPKDALEMVNRLYKDGNYREAIEGLRLLRFDMFEDYNINVEFKNKIDGMIGLCLDKIRASR